MNKPERPRVYLEEDCPVEEIGVECKREHGFMTPFPAPNRLHVWWARRPLTISRAAIAGSLLPDTTSREDFLALLGIPRGADPLVGKKIIAEISAGVRRNYSGDKYGYRRAFSVGVPEKDLEQARVAMRGLWNTDQPSVLDPFGGGGSIPFEAARLQLPGISNELNPVAHILQKATMEFPTAIGPDFEKEIERAGNIVADAVEAALMEFFPRPAGEEAGIYVWVRTVTCASCEFVVPLSPNWWLNRKEQLGFQPYLDSAAHRASFRIARPSKEFDPNAGTMARGDARCLNCATAIDGDHIKAEARAGRLGHQIAAVEVNRSVGGKRVRGYRAPIPDDEAAVAAAAKEVERRSPAWLAAGLLPMEERYVGPADRSALYGVTRMVHLFNPRQLLTHMVTVEVLLAQEWRKVSPEHRSALRTYLCLAFDKALDYNSIQSRLDASRGIAKNTFDRHDFSFKWSYCELDGARGGFRFGLKYVAEAYGDLCKLLTRSAESPRLVLGDATSLELEDDSVHAVITDPPYYDNVMYAELSDYFYVWQKRILGDVYPELFQGSLTDKDAEAVANVARFKSAARGKGRKLADEDYTAKMRSAFVEAHRVLRDTGVMTVMFTHKRLDAWDSLGRALIEAGFEITATWPIHTESEHSLHQAKKNAAASTILLVCRKRVRDSGSAWWNDIEGEVRLHVRERAEKFASMGLRGQDTSIASFGPALQVISRQWPVKRKDGTLIRPDEALDIAREEVMTWMFERIAEGQVKAVDKWTRFYILAWFVFGAREFPYDEARKLALSVKVDIDKELIPRKLIEKKSNNVRLLTPGERFKKGGLDPTKKEYSWDVDYVHAAIHAYETGMGAELSRFHQRAEALRRDGYKNAISYLLDVLPRVKEVTEYHTLDKLWEGNLQDEVKRRKPRTTDPTFEKQQRLEVSSEDEDGEASEEGEDEALEEDEE